MHVLHRDRPAGAGWLVAYLVASRGAVRPRLLLPYPVIRIGWMTLGCRYRRSQELSSHPRTEDMFSVKKAN